MRGLVPTALVALAALIITFGCSGANGAEPRASEPRAEEPAREASPSREDPAPDSPARAEPEPGSACGRALACCRAYAGAVPHVVEASACAGVYEATDTPDPDARCDAMKEGWRQALEHLPDAPVDACP